MRTRAGCILTALRARLGAHLGAQHRTGISVRSRSDRALRPSSLDAARDDGTFQQRGDQRKAEAIHAELEARSVTSNVQYFCRAISAIYLGRIDEAFELALESARARDGIGHLWVRFPDIEPILTHPRYSEMLVAMGA